MNGNDSRATESSSAPPERGNSTLASRIGITRTEGFGFLILFLLVVFFLATSWRKWADPVIDAGYQWYGAWQISQGAVLYRDFSWCYGPLSVHFNGLLFNIFGPGVMVLAIANLAIYGVILLLGYLTF